MISKITLGQAGRVVIPKSVRDEMHLSPGDTLELESADEKIVLRPVHPQPQLRREKGILVFYAGKPIEPGLIDRVRQQIRDERDAQNLGLS